MADIVNLNRARKKKRAAASKDAAAQNRAKFGRTKAEKLRRKTEDDIERNRLDGLKRDRDE